MSSLFYCRACDESFQASPGARCETCDSVLIPPPSSSSNTSAPESAETSSIPQTAEEIELNRDNLLDQFYRELLGEDLFEEITRSIQGQDPKRKIDVEYIKKAGNNNYYYHNSHVFHTLFFSPLNFFLLIYSSYLFYLFNFSLFHSLSFFHSFYSFN